uniref:CD99 antigen-like protein 2 n=1 Tax=Amazona collaria TaxID=241587 RepID=A0A8B9FMG6_9PSIT
MEPGEHSGFGLCGPCAGRWRFLFVMPRRLCTSTCHQRPTSPPSPGEQMLTPVLWHKPAFAFYHATTNGCRGSRGVGGFHGFVSLADSGGKTDNDYGGSRYQHGRGASSGLWDGGVCVPPPHSTPLLSLHPTGAVTDTGTIAGIASGLAMALVGAVTSYISYQQKKFCFSIQQGLNSEYVKGENMEAVVSEEPQGENLAFLTLSASGPKGSFTEGL